jgi:hypothetical protein
MYQEFKNNDIMMIILYILLLFSNQLEHVMSIMLGCFENTRLLQIIVTIIITSGDFWPTVWVFQLPKLNSNPNIYIGRKLGKC